VEVKSRMEIRELVNKELKSNSLPTYPGDYWNLDKWTITKIYHAVFNKMLAAHPNLDRDHLMKAIDVEVESRGYYAEGEKRDTPLVKMPGIDETKDDGSYLLSSYKGDLMSLDEMEFRRLVKEELDCLWEEIGGK